MNKGASRNDDLHRKSTHKRHYLQAKATTSTLSDKELLKNSRRIFVRHRLACRAEAAFQLTDCGSDFRGMQSCVIHLRQRMRTRMKTEDGTTYILFSVIGKRQPERKHVNNHLRIQQLRRAHGVKEPQPQLIGMLQQNVKIRTMLVDRRAPFLGQRAGCAVWRATEAPSAAAQSPQRSCRRGGPRMPSDQEPQQARLAAGCACCRPNLWSQDCEEQDRTTNKHNERL